MYKSSITQFPTTSTHHDEEAIANPFFFFFFFFFSLALTPHFPPLLRLRNQLKRRPNSLCMAASP
jgi:hypothetical protein